MQSICLITALPAEARPLISHFGLQARGHRHLRLYRGDFGYLLQCGAGKLNAAASTAAMMQALPDINAVINVGIAGCQQPLGQTLVAHGVQETIRPMLPLTWRRPAFLMPQAKSSIWRLYIVSRRFLIMESRA